MRPPKLMTPQERDDLRLINKLQHLNCYDALVKRLTEGYSAPKVARWVMDLKVEGAPGEWSFFYWRKHIYALAKHVRVVKTEMRKEHHGPTPKVEAIIERVESRVADLLCKDVVPDTVKDIWVKTEKTLRLLTSEQMLKVLYYRQLQRLERIIALEEKMGTAFENTHREVEKLTNLATAVSKLELGQQFLRGKGGNGPYLPPPCEIQPGDLADIEEGMRQFDEVDRNLIRQATQKLIDMVQEDVSGSFEAVRLDAVSGREAHASGAGLRGDRSPDVAEGA